MSSEEIENEPPQNVPFWHKDCFEMKSVKAQKAQEEFLFYLPLNYLKEFTQSAWSERKLSPEINYKYGLGVVSWGEAQQGLEIKFLSVSHCLCLIRKAFVYQTFALLYFYILSSSPLKSYASLPSPQLRMIYKPQLFDCLWVSYSFGGSHTYIIIFFSPGRLSYVNLPAKESRGVQEKLFFLNAKQAKNTKVLKDS